MQNLYRRGDFFWVRFSYKGRKLHQSTKETTTTRAKIRCEELIREFKDQVEHRGPRRKWTVGEWWERYEKLYTSQKRAGWRDQQCVDPFLAVYERWDIDDVTRTECINYLHERQAQGLKNPSVNRERGFLQALFERAVEEEVLKANPWKGIPRLEETPRERVLTYDEESELRRHCTPTMDRWLTYMLGTGLRIVEACAVAPRDVHFEENYLTVPADVAKNGLSRDVPLYPAVKRAIEEQIIATATKPAKHGGRLWNAIPQNYRKELAILCKKAGIPLISPHTLRHTFGTRFIENGGDVHTLAKVMGHSSVNVTIKNYVHERREPMIGRTLAVDVLTPPVPKSVPLQP